MASRPITTPRLAAPLRELVAEQVRATRLRQVSLGAPIAVTRRLYAALEVGRRANALSRLATSLVHALVNVVLAAGGEPRQLVPLAVAESDRELEEMVTGLARGCRGAGAELGVGELAVEHGKPLLAATLIGSPRPGERREPAAGSLIYGLPWPGVFAAGFEAAGAVTLERGIGMSELVPGTRTPVADLLLAGQKSFRGAVDSLLVEAQLDAMVVVGEGGLTGSLRAALPQGLGAEIDLGAWPMPPVYPALAALAGLDTAGLLETWSGGLGCLLIAPEERARVPFLLKAWNEPFQRVGRVVAGEGVRLLGSST